ncbi:MAG: cell surface protein, partial [Pseudomonadales bacterium]
MPTRRYTVAANYAAGDVNQAVATIPATGAVGDKTAYRFLNAGVSGNIFSAAGNTSVNTQGQICVEAQSQTFFDREERFQEDGAIFSPGTVSKTQLCGEVSVLAFSTDNSSLAASVARQNVAAPYTNGWGIVNFSDATPVLGAAFLKLTNPQASAGTSGTYGITWPHAYVNAAQ